MPAKEPTLNKQVADSYAERFIKHKSWGTDNVFISATYSCCHCQIGTGISQCRKRCNTCGYIDTILEEHLQLHKEEINEIYRQRPDDLL